MRRSRRNTLAQGKVGAYIGFCFRARKITLGYYAISALSGGVYLLILDSKAAKNSIDNARKLLNKFKCPMVICHDNFEDLIGKADCRLAAIRDKSLAEAILNCGDKNYELYTGGEY